jgi:hypothetical protein
MKKLLGITGCAMVFCLAASVLSIRGGDYWTPRGAPETDAGKMKTLDQVEPRQAISSLPYEITNSGSFYVICRLSGAPAKDGITIRANHVRLDLCGFPLIGTNNSGSGIIVPEVCDNISIRNGVICNWGGFGINATNARDAALADVKAFGNYLGGLYVGDNALVERCSAYGNGDTNAPQADPPMDDGIRAGSFSTVTGCKSRFNRGAGIHTYFFSRITECIATESRAADGVHVEDYCTVRDSTAAKNWLHGIRVASRCRVAGNTCGENGFMDPQTNACGIFVDGNNNIIQDNNVMGNDFGIQINTGKMGNFVVRNLSGKNVPPNNWPSWPASNYVGPIEAFQGTMFTNSNPWANFEM